ncbi:MAG: hypothetical protein U0105_20655 [Candidatus Obscuribacterales bacterium]
MTTEAQRSAFLAHLMNAHSWHTKLPLLTGGTFIIMLAPDGKDAFGKLDYMWRIDKHDDWTRDGASPIKLGEDVKYVRIEQLFPYVSCGHDYIGFDICQSDLKLIRAGATHPHRQQLAEWFKRLQREERCWKTLTDEERSMVVKMDLVRQSFIEFGTPPSVVKAYGLLRATNEIWRQLHMEEIAKLKDAIDKVSEVVV